MTKPADMYVVYNLRSTYHELGEYTFKIVLNPDFFKSAHTSDVKVLDSDGKEIRTTVSKWGRKINCSFKIDHDVADGVAVVKMNLGGPEGSEQQPVSCSFTFWVVKP